MSTSRVAMNGGSSAPANGKKKVETGVLTRRSGIDCRIRESHAWLMEVNMKSLNWENCRIKESSSLPDE